MILGVHWLRTFNLILFDFDGFKVMLSIKGGAIVLQGLNECDSPLKSCEGVEQLLHKNVTDFQTLCSV